MAQDRKERGSDHSEHHQHEKPGASSAELSRRDFLGSTTAGVAAGALATAGFSTAVAAPPNHANNDVGVLQRLKQSERDAQRRILIKGGTVLSKDSSVGDFKEADILIEGKTIKEVRPNIGASNAITVDASNTIVMPG